MMIQILLSVCMLSQAQDIVRITQEHKDRAAEIMSGMTLESGPVISMDGDWYDWMPF